jgi:hypothetical protein
VVVRQAARPDLADGWDEDPELWFALLPEHVESPFRSVVRVS